MLVTDIGIRVNVAQLWVSMWVLMLDSLCLNCRSVFVLMIGAVVMLMKMRKLQMSMGKPIG